MEIPEFDDKLANLHSWLKENGLDVAHDTHLKVQMSANKSEGYCLVAKTNCEPNATLIRIPAELLINYRYAFRHEQLRQFLDWYSSNTDEKLKLTRLDALYLRLLVDKFDPNSFLYKFIRTMPVAFTTPEYFPAELVDLLPVYLKIEIKQRLASLEKKFLLIKRLLDRYSSNRSTESEPFTKIMNKHLTMENFKWVFCSVNSRCFFMDEKNLCTPDEIKLANGYFGYLNARTFDQTTRQFDSVDEYESEQALDTESNNNCCCLSPFIDFANHSFTNNAYGEFNVNDRVYEIKSLSVDDLPSYPMATRVRANEQVFIVYGCHDNTKLLVEYGFIIDGNVFDKLEFKLDDIFKLWEERLSPTMERLFINRAVKDNLLNDLSCYNNDGPSWSLIRTLNLLNYLNEANKDDLDDLELDEFDTNEIACVDEIKRLYLKLLTKYRGFLNETCLQKLQTYADSCTVNSVEHYMAHMSLKLAQSHLNIVEFNLNLVNDDTQWETLF